MPAKELKKDDMLITHGLATSVSFSDTFMCAPKGDTIIQKSYDGCQRRFPGGIVMKMISISFIINELVKSHDLPLRRRDAEKCILKIIGVFSAPPRLSGYIRVITIPI